MDALESRTSIINHFYNNIGKFKLDVPRTFDELVYSYDTSEIRHNIALGTFEFFMNVMAEIEERSMDFYNRQTYMKPFEQKVLVFKIDGDVFSMVSVDPDDTWIYQGRMMVTVPSKNGMNGNMFEQEVQDVIKTNLKMEYKNIPSSEEEHFQMMTVTDNILELEECLKVIEMKKLIESMGHLIASNEKSANKWRVYFKFKEDLSGDA